MIVTGGRLYNGTNGNTEKLVLGVDNDWSQFDDTNPEDVSCATVQNEVICSQGILKNLLPAFTIINEHMWLKNNLDILDT